ncbi:MAG: hypothetical protein IJR58_05245, partial [Lachnospiraceae bacterium]|nr:hypothetical protein [Lachnospiraceae bacterium]
TAPWRMLEEEETEELKETEDSEDETPHQSAALTASPQGEAQETGGSEEEEEPATPGVTLDEILEQEIAETAIAEDAAENLLPEGSADDIVEEIIEIGGFAEVEEPTTEEEPVTDDLFHEEEVAETSEDLPLEGVQGPGDLGFAPTGALRPGDAGLHERRQVSAEPTDEVSDEPATDDEPAREMTGMEKVIAVAAAAAAARESGEELSQEASDEADTDEMQQEDAQEELPDREPGATTGDIPEISAEVASILDGLEEEQPPEDTLEALSDLPMEETEESAAQEPAEETDETAAQEAAEETEEITAQEAAEETEETEQTEQPKQQEEPEETGEHPPENEPEKTRNAKDDDDPVDKEMEARVRAMTQEEKVLFGPYIMQKSARRQIIHAIDNMSMAADVGNAIVTGEEGAGSLSLAKGLIRSVQLSDSNFSGKVAKISGSALNTKDISSIFDQLLDGALIIHKASGMSNETASSLRKALQKETKGMIVILEDNRKAMNRFLKENETLNESFSVRVDIEPLDDDALISYAKKYAEKRGYMIDEFGILALHTVIDDMQTVDHRVTLAEVKEIVDKAIVHADKKDAGYFFDVLLRKRYSDEDMVVLHEKDFMAGR